MGLATGHPFDLVAVGSVTVLRPVVVDVRPAFPMATTAPIAGLYANGQQLRRWRLTMPRPGSTISPRAAESSANGRAARASRWRECRGARRTVGRDVVPSVWEWRAAALPCLPWP